MRKESKLVCFCGCIFFENCFTMTLDMFNDHHLGLNRLACISCKTIWDIDELKKFNKEKTNGSK